MIEPSCKLADCPRRPHKSGQGLCGPHYQAALRDGTLPRRRIKGGPCSIEGCDGVKFCRGWCKRHYDRWSRLGDPTAGKLLPMPERFWDKVSKSPDDGCWLWTSALTVERHGVFRLEGRTVSAHRLAYEMAVGQIPEGLEIDHTCHSRDLTCRGGKACMHRRCVNPDHLEPVTHLVNVQRGRTNGNKTRCPQGHPYDESNTHVGPTGFRFCRICMKARNDARYPAARGA